MLSLPTELNKNISSFLPLSSVVKLGESSKKFKSELDDKMKEMKLRKASEDLLNGKRSPAGIDEFDDEYFIKNINSCKPTVDTVDFLWSYSRLPGVSLGGGFKRDVRRVQLDKRDSPGMPSESSLKSIRLRNLSAHSSFKVVKKLL